MFKTQIRFVLGKLKDPAVHDDFQVTRSEPIIMFHTETSGFVTQPRRPLAINVAKQEVEQQINLLTSVMKEDNSSGRKINQEG